MNPASGVTTPMFAGAASTMIAAICAPRSAKSSRTASRSWYGSTMVCAAIAAGHPGRAGQREGRDARSRLGEESVGVAVVVAGELHEQVAPGRAAREPDRGHRGFGAGGDEADALDELRPDPVADGERELGFGGVGGAEAEAERRGIPHRIDHGGMRVAEDRRPPLPNEVDVLPALDIGEVRTAARDVGARRAADRAERAHGGVDAAGQDAARGLERLGVRALVRHGHARLCWFRARATSIAK